MKRILIFPLLLLSGMTPAAEDAALVNAVNARVAQLQTEVWQLDDALHKLGSMELTDTQQYELIAEPGFSATNEIVSSYGLTLKQLYSYEATHQQALDAWLQEHPDQVDQINTLEDEIMQLQLQFDQLVQADSG